MQLIIQKKNGFSTVLFYICPIHVRIYQYFCFFRNDSIAVNSRDKIAIHETAGFYSRPEAIHFALLQIRLMRNKQKEQDASKTRRTVDF